MKYLALTLGVIIIVGIVVLFIPFDGSDTDKKNTLLDTVLVSRADGTETTIGAFTQEDRVLVVNSWATWCPFCIDELPDFVALQEEFGDSVLVIAVNRRESVDAAETYLNSLDVADDLVYLYDPNDDWYRLNGGFSMPETLFINSAGEVIVHKRGFMALDEMREHVQTTLSSNN